MDVSGGSPVGIEHLFRHESGRIVATVTRILGVHNLALAEDVAQDAFWRALEVWKIRGVPENPSAWLMATAKNRALDVIRRERTARAFAPEVTRLLNSEWTLAPAMEELFAENAIKDDLLRMMFSCCRPRMADEVQVALILHILCGFSVHEIASAFVTSTAAIQKRITRGKKVLAGSQRLFDVTSAADFAARLPTVLRALYLLFSEGYHGASPDAVVRAELCHEAMRLAALIIAHPHGSVPAVYALAALMCFDAARLPARLDESGNLVSLFDQDRSRWDPALVMEGSRLLEAAAFGPEITSYHIEAAIASVHARAIRIEDTNWAAIVSLYDRLMTVQPSPIVALNRAIAIGLLDGPEIGLKELEAIVDSDRLRFYPFYAAAIGEFELRRGDHAAASNNFRAAVGLARNAAERRFLESRLRACEPGQ